MLYHLWIITESASAAALLISGLRMLAWTRRLELSTRSGLAWSMIAAAALTAWSMHIGAQHPAACISAAVLACVSAWLVWWPHRHPALERVTTGFGVLDQAGAAESRLQ